MTKKQIALNAVEALKKEYPDAICSLVADTPFQLLVATRLSAQCTDARVNLVTPALFKKYPTLEDYCNAELSDVEEIIHSCGFYRAKAKDIKGMAIKIRDDFEGKVPDSIEKLTSLPGVGRKTANVIQAVIFKKAKMAVDTHVFRVSHRIGLVTTKCTTPLSVEKQLTKHLPEEIIPLAHHWLILHGRYVCQSRTPHCEKCGLTTICKHFSSKGLQI